MVIIITGATHTAKTAVSKKNMQNNGDKLFVAGFSKNGLN